MIVLLEYKCCLQTLSGIHEHWMEQLSNYQSAHVDYIGSDALSIALAVYLGPLSPELRLEFINHHWSKCLKERGIELSWSNTEKVLIPSVTDEVGQNGFNLDDGESPDAPPTAVANGDNDTTAVANGDDGDLFSSNNDNKVDNENGMSI